MRTISRQGRRHLLAGVATCVCLGLGAMAPGCQASTPAPAKPFPAPELRGAGEWFNSPPLKLAALRGKVVLIDFWTYSCVNCLRSMPYVNKWHERYADKGLVVIGVHTPEYAFERSPEGVKKALSRYGIKHAVVQDNGYDTWKAFNNQYWPAVYLIDRSGAVVFQHYGEGSYDEIEATIRRLLAA